MVTPIRNTQRMAAGIIALLAIIVLISFGSILVNGIRMASRHAPLVDATMEVKHEASLAMLSAHQGSIPSAMRHLDTSDWYIGALLYGGSNTEGTFPPIEGRAVRADIEAARKTLDLLRKQIDNPSSLTAKSLYDRFIYEIDTVETRIQADLKESLVSFSVTTASTAAIVTLLFAIAFVVTGRVVANRDTLIDRLREQQAAAEANADYLSTTMRCMGDAMIITDNTGRVTDMNPKAEELTGWSIEDARNRHIEDVFVIVNEETLAPAEDIFKKVIQSGETVGLSNHTLLIGRDGTNVSIADSAAPIISTSGVITGVVIIFHDTTRNRAYQRELEAVNRDLVNRAAREAKRRIRNEQMLFEQKKFVDMGQMVSAIAHQWRQPLNALSLSLGYLQELSGHRRLETAEADQTFTQAEQVIQRMSKTIDDFRQFFASGQERDRFDPVAAIIQVLELMGAQLTANDISYATYCACTDHPDGDTPHDITTCTRSRIHVIGNPGEFKQVVLNVVANAKDALVEQNGTELRRTIKIVVSCGEGALSVRFEDNGGGIPEDQIGKVFDPYYTTKEEGKGTGIGLYMSKLVIEENMGGTIRVENSGDGARVSIVLPAAPEDPEESGNV